MAAVHATGHYGPSSRRENLVRLDLDGVAALQTKLKTTRKRKESEHCEQVALFEWAKLQERVIPELALLMAVPLGGKRHPAVAAKMKAEGVKAGYPDLILDVARAGFHGLRIELKAGKNTASAEQKDWLAWLSEQGYCCYIAYGWIAARRLILEYLAGRPMPGLVHKETAA